MVNESLDFLPRPQHLSQYINHQIGMQWPAAPPINNIPGKNIDDKSHINKSHPRCNKYHACHPQLIWPGCHKPANYLAIPDVCRVPISCHAWHVQAIDQSIFRVLCVRNGSIRQTVQPIFDTVDFIVGHCGPRSFCCSNTNLTTVPVLPMNNWFDSSSSPTFKSFYLRKNRGGSLTPKLDLFDQQPNIVRQSYIDPDTKPAEHERV